MVTRSESWSNPKSWGTPGEIKVDYGQFLEICLPAISFIIRNFLTCLILLWERISIKMVKGLQLLLITLCLWIPATSDDKLLELKDEPSMIFPGGRFLGGNFEKY